MWTGWPGPPRPRTATPLSAHGRPDLLEAGMARHLHARLLNFHHPALHRILRQLGRPMALA